MRYLYFSEIDSTNNFAIFLADTGFNEDIVIYADYQIAGRGRGGNKWHSSRGKDILFSILLHPNIPANRISYVTYIVASAVRKAVYDLTKVKLSIKRPNDLMLGGKKISGILTESKISGDDVEFIVVGIGFNLNSAGKEIFPGAISLKEFTGSDYDREKVMKKIVSEICGGIYSVDAGIL